MLVFILFGFTSNSIEDLLLRRFVSQDYEDGDSIYKRDCNSSKFKYLYFVLLCPNLEL